MIRNNRQFKAWIFILSALFFPPTLHAADISPSGDLTSQTYETDGNIITGNPCVVGPGVNVTFSSEKVIQLKEGFWAKPGGTFKATILVDNDGLANEWELFYFGDLNQNPDGDYDGDGLTNKQEFELATNPVELDTDEDGLSDYIEVTYGSTPNNPLSRLTPGNYYDYDELGRIKNIVRIH